MIKIPKKKKQKENSEIGKKIRIMIVLYTNKAGKMGKRIKKLSPVQETLWMTTCWMIKYFLTSQTS